VLLARQLFETRNDGGKPKTVTGMRNIILEIPDIIHLQSGIRLGVACV
jgi:hypothetical protein